MELIRNNRLNNDIILVDGHGSSGKSLIAQIISNYSGVEKPTAYDSFTYIPELYRIDKIDRNLASILLLMENDRHLYNNYLGREINFRRYDITSVFKYHNPLLYIKRSLSKDRNKPIDNIKSENPAFLVFTHNNLADVDLFYDTFKERMKFIYVNRNPIDIIDLMYKRDYSNRIEIDPINMEFKYRYNNSELPIYINEDEDTYLNENSMEKTVDLIYNRTKRDIDKYKIIPDNIKNKIMIIDFDDFVENPMIYCMELRKFLKRDIPINIERILKKENCPRIVNKENRNTIKNKILCEIDGNHSKRFYELIKIYEEIRNF